MGIESSDVESWPTADARGDGLSDATPVLIEARRELAAAMREIADLRERIALLQTENERLAIAARAREQVAHSTLPLRAIGVSDIAQMFGMRTPSK